MTNFMDPNEAGEVVEVFRAEMKLPKFDIADCQKIMDIVSNLDSLAKMDLITLAEMNVTLQAYAVWIQEEENRCLRYMNFARDNLDFIVSSEWESIESDYLDAKRIAVLANHGRAKELHATKITAQLKYDTIRQLAERINRLSKSLDTLIYAKRHLNYKS